jgi:hypothetical protein
MWMVPKVPGFKENESAFPVPRTTPRLDPAAGLPPCRKSNIFSARAFHECAAPPVRRWAMGRGRHLPGSGRKLPGIAVLPREVLLGALSPGNQPLVCHIPHQTLLAPVGDISQQAGAG